MKKVVKQLFPGNFFTRYLDNVLCEYLPSKLKRMFYVVSVMSVITKDRSPCAGILRVIARPLRLGYDTTMMMFPAYISSSIWKNLDADKLLTIPVGYSADLCTVPEKELWVTGMVFAKHCPDWLQYGSTQLMASDVHDLLSTLSRISTPNGHQSNPS